MINSLSILTKLLCLKRVYSTNSSFIQNRQIYLPSSLKYSGRWFLARSTTARLSSTTTNFQNHQHSYNNRRDSAVNHLYTTNHKMTANDDNTLLYCSKTLSSHLSSVVTQLQENEGGQNINVIVGNEAGDADSIISSLALSYIKTLHQSTHNDKHDGNLILHVPVASIVREDMTLRQDTVTLLSMTNIDYMRDILYTNDLNIVSILSNNEIESTPSTSSDKNLQLTLVDHNKIRSSLMHLDSQITEILDHHRDESYHMHIPPTSDKRNIAFDDKNNALVGSTCTLITEELKRTLTPSEMVDTTSRDNIIVDPELALLLLGVIVLDTMNMDVKAGRGTQRDENAIQFLISHTPWNKLLESLVSNKRHPNSKLLDIFHHDKDEYDENEKRITPDREKLFKHLSNAKFDPSFWNNMNTNDCLRIDYKKFDTQSKNVSFGLSSVLLPISKLIEKDRFHQSVIKFMNKLDDTDCSTISILGVLSLVVDNDPNVPPQREMFLVGGKEIIVQLVEYCLSDENAKQLQFSLDPDFKMMDISGGEYVGVYLTQGNIKGSRKQVAPVLLDFFNGTKS